MSEIRVPRIVIAGTASGVGKTTTMVALAGALRARGLTVATFKCGPDYLDPTYHARVTGVPSRNLDGWMMGRDAVLATFERASAGADVALIEGVMGLFDGASPTSEEGSTAEIAKWLGAPVLVCVDASGMARTIGAVALGFARFDSALDVAGLITIGVGSKGHLELLRAASPDVPIVGALPTRSDLAFPERHLGLVRADREHVPDSRFEAWAAIAAEWIDLDPLLALARGAKPIAAPATSPARAATRARIGIAHDEAFHFYYEDNLARLEAAGAELVRFSPVHDSRLPEVDGIYIGGGYPEVHAQALAANVAMRDAVRALAASGAPIYGECGGLMYLVDAIQTLDGARHPMLGLLPGVAVLRDRLQSLGYVEVSTREPSILGPAGLSFRGHQFRYSTLERPEAAAADPAVSALYELTRRRGGGTEVEGWWRARVLGSYVHAHWASCPEIPVALVESCAASRAARASR